MKIKICPICAVVAGTWLLLTVGIWLGFLTADGWKIIASALMGGSVVGIAYQRDTVKWRVTTIILGMPLVYLLIINLSGVTIAIEIILLSVLAHFLFRKDDSAGNKGSRRLKELEEKLKKCC